MLYCTELRLCWFQDDEDGHLVVLQIIEDLMTKAQEIFLDHFAKLGVFSKVGQLAGPQDLSTVNESQTICKRDDVSHTKHPTIHYSWNPRLLVEQHSSSFTNSEQIKSQSLYEIRQTDWFS